MEIIRIQAERGGYTPPRQVAKLIAVIDEHERDTLLTRADECDRVANIMEYTLQVHVSVADLRKRAARHRREAAQT